MARISLPHRTDSPDAMGRRHHRRVRIALVAGTVCILLILALCYEFRRPWFRSNLDIVDAGRVIRSAQPTSQLPGWIRDYGLRSILNLRGGSVADSWYDAEVKAAQTAGVLFYDLPLSATRRPGRDQLLKLIDTLRSCPYPLLIHCKSGADRTGLASALYLMLEKKLPPLEAEKAFALEYAHIPVGGPQHLHEPLREYAAWLAASGLPHSPERFRHWVKRSYEPSAGSDEPSPLEPGPRPARH